MNRNRSSLARGPGRSFDVGDVPRSFGDPQLTHGRWSRGNNGGMQISPVTDLDELAEIRDFMNRVPITGSAHVEAKRRPGDRGAYGISMASGEPPPKKKRPGNPDVRRLNEAFGWSERRLRLLCGSSKHPESSRGTLALWEHVAGNRPVSPEELAQRKKIWSDSDVEPWRGWLFDHEAKVAYRDYQDGAITVSCAVCRRTGIEVNLRRVQESLAAGTKAETLNWIL